MGVAYSKSVVGNCAAGTAALQESCCRHQLADLPLICLKVTRARGGAGVGDQGGAGAAAGPGGELPCGGAGLWARGGGRQGAARLRGGEVRRDRPTGRGRPAAKTVICNNWDKKMR